jgi:uncharacterized membrane protein
MYNLNKQSRTAKFYEWVWNTNVTKFKTMCPYTWSYIFTILFIVPILIVKLLVYLLKKSTKSINISANNINPPKAFVNAYNYLGQQDKLWYYSGKIIKWLFIISASIFILVFLSYIIYEWYKYPMEGFALLGVIFLIAIIAVLIAYIFLETKLFNYIAIPFKFIGETVSNLYNNICPLIVWENKTKDK